jgi:hypothetical protein
MRARPAAFPPRARADAWTPPIRPRSPRKFPAQGALRDVDLSGAGVDEQALRFLLAGCAGLRRLALRACTGVTDGCLAEMARLAVGLSSLLIGSCNKVPSDTLVPAGHVLPV